MKEVMKVVASLVLVGLCFGMAINGVDNPKPSKLAATITREIKKATQ